MALKQGVADYPDALRRAVLQDYFFMADFSLTAFAPKVAARSDAYGTAACLTRSVNELVMALFALNRKYPINDKTALAEVAEFERAPRDFAPRVQHTLGHLGTSAADLLAAVESIGHLAVCRSAVGRGGLLGFLNNLNNTPKVASQVLLPLARLRLSGALRGAIRAEHDPHQATKAPDRRPHYQEAKLGRGAAAHSCHTQSASFTPRAAKQEKPDQQSLYWSKKRAAHRILRHFS